MPNTSPIQTIDADNSKELCSSNIYNQTRIIDFDEHIKKKERFRYSKLHWEQIPRANNPSKPLQEKSLSLLAVIVHKLRKNELVLLNHNYLSRITKCTKDQNVNLLKQLADVLDISFHAKIVIKGKIFRNCYVIKHTEKGRAIIENPEVLLAQKHFVGKVAVTPVEKTTTEDKEEGACAEFFRPSYIYKEKVLENNRSNESTFSYEYNTKIQSETSSFVETKNTVVTEEHNQSAIIHNLKSNKPRLNINSSNKRKKPTNAQNKAKKAKLLHFNQYAKPKDLAGHYPLTAEDCSLLQSKSGREFDINAINEILLSMSTKPKQRDHKFPSKASFLCYMSKALIYEKREAVKINNSGFKIKANLTEEQITERTTLAQRESYLAEIEDRAITHRSDELQFKAKLVGTLSPNQAYNILFNLKRVKKREDILELHLNKMITLTEFTKSLILSQANAVGVYSGVERLELVLSNNDISIDEQSRAVAAK